MSINKSASSVEDLSAYPPPPINKTRSYPWDIPSVKKHRRDSLDEEDYPPLGSSSDSSDTSTTNQINPAKEDVRLAALIRDKPVSRFELECPEECMMSGGLSEDDDRCEQGRDCILAKAREDQAPEERADSDEVETKAPSSEGEDYDEYSDDSSSEAYGTDDYDDGVQYGVGTQWGWL